MSTSVPNTATPRQLVVAEEMDSFFPFDPFKLPLSSIYIDDIYRDWEDDEGGDGSASSSGGTSSDTDEDSDSDDDDDDDESDSGAEGIMARGGLAVPGSERRREEDDEVARSFEAMSLSPDRNAFGGRNRKAQETAFGSIETLVV